MSSFVIDRSIPRQDLISSKGRLYHIACKAWFTATGAIYPLSFKFEGEDGVLIAVKDISIKDTKDKLCEGIRSREYNCEAIIGGITQKFTLLFYPEVYKWVMLV